MMDSVLAVKLDHVDNELSGLKETLIAVLASDSGAKAQTGPFVVEPDKTVSESVQL